MPWSVIVFLIVFLLIYEPLVLVVSAGNPNSNSKIRKAKSDAAENVLGSKTKSSQERDPPGALAAKSSTDDSDDFLEEKYGVRYPTPCETCRLLTLELDARLRETGKTSETLGTVSSGHKKYAVSELRFIESLEGLCQRMLGYSLHKEFNDVRRFAKGQSETMKTLQNLVAKGVKVDIGIPGQLWDEPSAEVAHLKTACEGMLERYEEDLEEWYHAGMGVPLADFLCSEQRALRGGEDPSCLTVDLTDRRRPSPPAKTAETGTKKQEL